MEADLGVDTAEVSEVSVGEVCIFLETKLIVVNCCTQQLNLTLFVSGRGYGGYGYGR